MNYEAFYLTFCNLIRDVLGLDESDELPATARWFEDLNGESIELLELGFCCEKQFKQRISLTDMLSKEKIQLTDAGAIEPGVLADMQARYPMFDYNKLPEHPTPESLRGLLTVRALAALAHSQLRFDGEVVGTATT